MDCDWKHGNCSNSSNYNAVIWVFKYFECQRSKAFDKIIALNDQYKTGSIQKEKNSDFLKMRIYKYK